MAGGTLSGLCRAESGDFCAFRAMLGFRHAEHALLDLGSRWPRVHGPGGDLRAS